MHPENLTTCSFCGKNAMQVVKLIAGPGVYICDSCVDVCKKLVDRERNPTLAISLRPATATDENAVLALTKDFATSFKVEAQPFSSVFASVISAPGHYFTVAVSGTEVVGYAHGHAHSTLFATGPVAWVEEIMLRKDMRRVGIGKMLMDDFEKWALLQKCRMIALATRRAADFYRSLGYEESATYFRKKLIE